IWFLWSTNSSTGYGTIIAIKSAYSLKNDEPTRTLSVGSDLALRASQQNLCALTSRRASTVAHQVGLTGLPLVPPRGGEHNALSTHPLREQDFLSPEGVRNALDEVPWQSAVSHESHTPRKNLEDNAVTVSTFTQTAAEIDWYCEVRGSGPPLVL